MAPIEDVLVERPADDSAVVVFSGEHDLASAPDGGEVMTAFAATLERGPIELRELRQSLRSWLELTTATASTRDAVVLATHEATANAMVHGQHGRAVSVLARQNESGDFEVEVSNRGGWEEPAPGDGGRGLAIMKELMREVEIHTSVRMRSGEHSPPQRFDPLPRGN